MFTHKYSVLIMMDLKLDSRVLGTDLTFKMAITNFLLSV